MSAKNSYGRKTIQLQFQLVVEELSPYWSIVKYYQGVEKEKARQMLLEAAWQYWLPFAFEEGDRPEMRQRAKSEARKASYWLQHQINFLESQFEVEVVNSARLKPLGYRGQGRVNFRFRYQLRAQQEKLIELIQYLMDVPESFVLEQKLLSSSLAYWGVIADRELGLLNEEGLNQSAANCIIRLGQHIEYLADFFQLKEAPEIPMMALPTGWSSPEIKPSQLNEEKEQNKVIEAKKETEGDENQEIQHLLRGNPKNDHLIAKIFEN